MIAVVIFLLSALAESVEIDPIKINSFLDFAVVNRPLVAAWNCIRSVGIEKVGKNMPEA